MIINFFSFVVVLIVFISITTYNIVPSTWSVEHAINADQRKVDEWYDFDQMKKNHSKCQAITFGSSERNPVLTCCPWV